jgi:hypothetical protein
MAAADHALAVVAALVCEDGRRWGERAAPWQRDDARAILDLDGPRRHYLTRPRGGSKTDDVGAVSIGALLEQLPALSKSYAFAADREQAGLIIDSVDGFRARTPGLSSLVVGAGKLTNTATGASLEVMSSDDASAWGLRPHLVLVDEFAQWPTTPKPRRLWRAIFSALPKVATSRLVVMTSSGDPAHPAYGVLERARASERWRVSEVPGPVSWQDPEDLEEQRDELPAWEFARLILNRWTEPAERLTTIDDLRACVRLDGPREWRPGRFYVISLDIGLKNDRTVAAVTSVEAGGSLLSVALDRMAVWQGTRESPVELGEVEAWILEAWTHFGGAPTVIDPYQGAQLKQRLEARGLGVFEYTFTQSSVSRLALRLHGLISDHALELPDDSELIEELANVRLRETSPGVYRLDHDSDKHDDRAIALALGCWGLVDSGWLGLRHEVEPEWGEGRELEYLADSRISEF